MQLRPLTALLLFLLCLTSWAKPPVPASPLRIRLSSAPQTLDWNIATSGSENAIIQNIMEGLFAQDSNGLPQLVLAKKVEWSKDRKQLKIEIKDDVRWTDGKLLKSSHFIDSFARLLNPHLNSQNASLLFDVVGARDYFLGKLKNFEAVGIQAPDSKHLVIQLNEPRANFLSLLTHPATDPLRLENPNLTLGAYRVKSYTPTSISLVAKSSLNTIQNAYFEVIPDSLAALEAFRQNKIDYLLQIEDSLFTRPELKNLPQPSFVEVARGVALLHLNPNHLATNSPEKRRRIMSLISLSALFAGHGDSREKAPSLIPAGMLGGPRLQEKEYFIPQGTQSETPTAALTLAYPNDAFSRSIAETIQKESKALKLKIEALPSGEFSSASKRYDLVLTLYSLDYGDPDQLLASFLSQGTHDLFNASSNKLSEIMQKARMSEDATVRGGYYREAALSLENEIAIVMPLFYRRRGFLIRPQFKFDEKRQGTVVLSQIHFHK